MVNLIAGKRVVPELIQSDFTASNVVLHMQPLLNNEDARNDMQANLHHISDMLKASGSVNALCGQSPSRATAIDRVAHTAVGMLHPQDQHEPR